MAKFSRERDSEAVFIGCSTVPGGV